MKGVILILAYSLVWLPTELSPRLIDSGRQEPPKQNQQPQVIIDEILEGCGPLFFKSNSSKIGVVEKACLDEISEMLRRADNYFLVVDAHRAPSEKDKVSTGRIKKAREYLAKQKGIGPARLIIRDFGDSCLHESGEAIYNARLEFLYWREKEKVDSIPKRCAGGAKPRYRMIE